MRDRSVAKSRMLGSDSAQSLVELALVLPILVLVIFGVLDLGRLYFAQVAVTNASREGARYGMASPTDLPGIKSAAVNEAGGVVSASNVAGECAPAGDPENYGTCTSPQPGDRIRVTVSYDFQFVSLYLFGVSNLQLSDKTIMAIVQ